MRRSMSWVGILSLASAVIVLAAPSASSAVDSMSASGSSMGDHMAYLTGSWRCTVKISAYMGAAATTDHGTLTFSMAPGKTIHAHVAAADYMQDAYHGYDVKTKTHWTDSADTQGTTVSETSKDGVTFTGTSWSGGTSTPTRDTFTHPTESTIRDLTELETGGKWSTLTDADCTKM